MRVQIRLYDMKMILSVGIKRNKNKMKFERVSVLLIGNMIEINLLIE